MRDATKAGPVTAAHIAVAAAAKILANEKSDSSMADKTELHLSIKFANLIRRLQSVQNAAARLHG